MINKQLDIASLLNTQSEISFFALIKFIIALSIPSMLAQLTHICMGFIDAAMVGQLGAEASASIGIVSTSTWLVYGIVAAITSGFSVQVAQAIGAGEEGLARSVLRQSLIVCVVFSVLMALFAMRISFYLPGYLGAQKEVSKGATIYFFVFGCTLPVTMLNRLGTSMLQGEGDMKTPSVLSILMCALDVLFNSLFIFGMKLGVLGAALGTSAAQLTVCFFMMYFLCVKSKRLSLKIKGSWHLTSSCIKGASHIAFPMAFEQLALCGAQIMGTKIVAPLGTVAIASDSFGVTAEAFCYMPGYGIANAATTLVGQSVGAQKYKMARRFAFGAVITGMIVMALTAICMFFASSSVFRFFTPDVQVQKLGSAVLRIEMFAEPFFAAYIVSSAAMRGAGDTLVPGLINLASMWGLRIPLCIIFSMRYGLYGVWSAMCIQLTFTGIFFLVRLHSKSWIKVLH